jgi:hypothetical protein
MVASLTAADDGWLVRRLRHPAARRLDPNRPLHTADIVESLAGGRLDRSL